MMTLPIINMPDPFAAVLPYLQGFLDGRAESYVTGTKVDVKLLDTPTRFVWVRRVGGLTNNVVIDNVRLDFMVWHDGSTGDRIKLANLCRGAVLAMNGTYSGINVWGVTEFLGLADLPDPSNPQTTVSLFTVTASMRGTELSA